MQRLLNLCNFLFFGCRLLSKRDVEVVIKNGTPFTFDDADTSATRLRSLISSSETSVSTMIFVFFLFKFSLVVVCFYFLTNPVATNVLCDLM